MADMWKNAEPIEIPFGIKIFGWAKEPLLHGVQTG